MAQEKFTKKDILNATFVPAEGAIRTTGSGGSSGGSASGGGGSTYYAKPAGSPADAVSDYASATTLTVTGLKWDLTKYDIVSIRQIPNAGGSGTQDTTFSDIADFAVSVAGSVATITVTGATFAATDTFIVTISGQIKGYTKTSTSSRTEEINPLDQKYVPNSLVDTTNVSAATHYYPSATGSTMDGYKDISVTGKFIDADGTLTLTLEVSNDEDIASADWNAIKFFDDDSAVGALVSSLTVTNGTLLITASAPELNYTNYRWVVVASGATNTVILKERKKAL